MCSIVLNGVSFESMVCFLINFKSLIWLLSMLLLLFWNSLLWQLSMLMEELSESELEGGERKFIMTGLVISVGPDGLRIF